jgi:hypothetical protein
LGTTSTMNSRKVASTAPNCFLWADPRFVIRCGQSVVGPCAHT